MARDDRPSREDGARANGIHYEAAGGYLVAGLILFGGLGYWLDQQLGSQFLTPIGIVVGALAGGYLVYVRIIRDSDDSHEGERR